MQKEQAVMNLELAIVISGSPNGCLVQYLDQSEPSEAAFSAPVRDRIRIRRQQLVAVDRSVTPSQIVWRLFHGKVHAVDGAQVTVSRLDGEVEHVGENGLWLGQVTPAPDFDSPVAVGDVVFYEHGKTPGEVGELHDVAVDGRPAHPERVLARLYPKIVETYAALGA
jgi:hypothetical protein